MKLKLVIILLFLTSLICASEMVISKHLTEELGDLTLRQSPKTDMSGNRCALIKVSTDLLPFDEIESNKTPVAIENKIGEVWIYLSPGDKRLYFNKKGYARYKYDIPLNLKSNVVYSLTILGKGNNVESIDNVVDLIFNLNQDGVLITRNGKAPIKATSKTVQFSLARGKHSFKFEKPGFITMGKDIEVSKDELVNIDMQKGSSEVSFTSPGIVIIHSDPQGAQVELNGQLVGNTLGAYQGLHYAGDYTLTLKKKMYHSISKTFNLNSGETLEIPSIKLKPKFGYWQVSTNPPGADIYLDEKLVGKSPLDKAKIPSGNHTLRISNDRYKTHQESFEVKDGDQAEFDLDLQANFARVEINSAPEDGATVFIDNVEVGQTPYVDEMMLAGTYDVRIEKDLWSGSSETITVSPSSPIKELLILTKNFGTLVVNAPKSTIFLDGVQVANDSFTRNLVAGNYKIRVEKDKHKTIEKNIFVNIGETTTEDINPSPILASISVFAVDKRAPENKIIGADIYVDNEKTDKKTPSVMEMLYGKYNITLQHPKYLELTKSVSLKEGDTKTITFELDTYSGSLTAKRDTWKTQTYLGLISTALIVGGGLYCNKIANDNFDIYESTYNTTEAIDARSRTEDFENYRDYCYYSASVTTAYTVFSWIKTLIYGSELK